MKSIISIGFFLSGLLLISVKGFPQAKTNQSLNQPKKEAKMKNESSAFKEYILLVHLPLNYGPDQAKEVRERWNKLTDKWKADGTYVTSFVYPNDGYLVKGPQKNITKEGIVCDNFRLVSNLILRASNYEAALELAKNCPVLQQGGTIEVREIPPRVATSESGKELPKPRQ